MEQISLANLRDLMAEEVKRSNSATANNEMLKRLNGITRSFSFQDKLKGSSELSMTSVKRKLTDIFKCLICFNKITKDALLCPHCSKLWCARCINQWLVERKSECPHCRMHLTPRQLVNCRFAGEISDAMQDISDVTPVVETCDKHNTEITYFCKT